MMKSRTPSETGETRSVAETSNVGSEGDEGHAPALVTYFNVVAPRVPAGLVPRATLGRIERLARRLPAVELFGFETHLQTGEADFAVRVSRSAINGRARSRFLELRRSTGSACWARLLATGRTPSLADMWLEFDVSACVSETPVPSVFCGLAETYNYDGLDIPGRIRSLTKIITGSPLGADIASSLDRVLRALPPVASLLQFGLMLSRPNQGMKVVIRELPVDRVARFLRDVGWPGDPEQLTAQMSGWSDRVDDVFLSMDLAATVAPRLGLEMRFRDSNSPRIEGRWGDLLADLSARGLCGEDQRDALLGWQGTMTRETAGKNWPGNLGATEALLGGRRRAIMLRGINHIKVVVEPGCPDTAKAYFGARVAWAA